MSGKKLIRFDWAIKYILRNKANFDVLEAFLSNLLKEDIKVEEIIESESNRDAENRKFNRVDLRCKDSQGQQIIIEVQNQREADYLQRLLWGTSSAVVESLDLGERYSGVVKVISISILYHTMRLDEKENTDFIYYGTTELIGFHTKKPLVLHGAVLKGEKSPIVTAKDVFPEYYLIYVEKFNDMINEAIDEWVYFFKHAKIREDFKSPGIILAAKKLDYMMMDEKQRRAYDDYLAYLGREIDIIETAKEEGKEEGIKEGKEQGIKEGKQQGRKEEREEVAKKMLSMGMTVEMVTQATGLSVQKVKESSLTRVIRPPVCLFVK